MKLFAGRTSDGDYELGTSKKDFEGDYGFTDGTYLMFFCARFSRNSPIYGSEKARL